MVLTNPNPSRQDSPCRWLLRFATTHHLQWPVALGLSSATWLMGDCVNLEIRPSVEATDGATTADNADTDTSSSDDADETDEAGADLPDDQRCGVDERSTVPDAWNDVIDCEFRVTWLAPGEDRHATMAAPEPYPPPFPNASRTVPKRF